MARTFIRQATQIRRSEAYDDTLAHGAALESGAVSIEDDLNGLRAQIKRILDGSGSGKWYDNVPNYAGTPGGLAQINQAVTTVQSDLETLGDRKLLLRAQVLSDVTVPADQNWVVLDALNDAPTQPLAITANTLGVVVQRTEETEHSVLTIAGANEISPKNLVVVRDADTGQTLESGDRDIYGLLQTTITAVDGAVADNAANELRISFVRTNAAGNGLEAVPAADIAGRTINYSYVLRGDLSTLPEESFLSSGTFTDLTAEVDINLQRALQNQGTTVATSAADVTIAVGTGKSWTFERETDAADILQITGNGATGGGASLRVDAEDIKIVAAPGKYAEIGPMVLVGQGVMVGTSGSGVAVMSMGGKSLVQSSQALGLVTSNTLSFKDNGMAGSPWASAEGMRFSNSTDWSDFYTQFGEVSLLKGVVEAARQGARGQKTYATVTADVAADADVGGTSGGGNLDTQLPDLNYGTFTSDFDVYVNGELLRPGADASANNDYYPGTDLSLGQIKFEFPLRTGDVICVVPVTKKL